MAIAFTNLGASANPDITSGTDAASYANTSWTPPTSGLIYAFVHSARVSGPDAPTISGNNLTWVQIGQTFNGGSGRGMSLFAANAQGSQAGITTVDFGANAQLACVAAFGHITGADLSGGVAAAFVQQVADGQIVNSTAPSLTLAAAAHADNRPLACFVHFIIETMNARANWTKGDELNGSAYNRTLLTQWREDAFDTTASTTWATGSHWVGMAVEVKALQASAAKPTAHMGLGIRLGL